MKVNHSLCILAAAILTLPAQAVLIGVNFTGGNSGGAPTSMLPADVAGVPAYAQANFNNVSGSTGGPVSLFDSTGAATAVTLTFSGGGVWGSGVGADTPNRRLMNGYVDGLDNASNTYTFSNVPAGSYTLLIYSLPDALDGRDESLSITTGVVDGGPATYFLSADGGANFNANGFVRATGASIDGAGAAGNYVQFDNVTPDGTGTITITGTSLNFRNFANGIQLIPEPSVAIAIISGSAVLLGLRRRRHMAN